MSVTEETFQFDMLPLKDAVPKNIPCMFSTLETSQSERSWLKESALLNMSFILVTDETFQEDMLPLKDVAE